MKYLKNVSIFTAGAITGGVAVKTYPKTRFHKAIKLGLQLVEVSKRLNKAVLEEYYRIDEIISAEEYFLNIVAGELGVKVKFKVNDDGRNRTVGTHLSLRKDDPEVGE